MEEFNDDVSLDDASTAGRLLIWRKTIPEAERMQEALPRMLQRGDERRVDNVPQFWKDMMCSMRTQVRAQAESATGELSELPLLGVVAHEFAHVFFRRKNGEPSAPTLEGEMAMDKIAFEWGFGAELCGFLRFAEGEAKSEKVKGELAARGEAVEAMLKA